MQLKRSKNRPSFYAWPTLTVKNQQKGLSTTIADKVALLTVMPPWVSRLSMVTTTLKLQHSSSQISQSHTEKLNVSFSPTDEASLEKVHTGPIGKAVGWYLHCLLIWKLKVRDPAAVKILLVNSNLMHGLWNLLVSMFKFARLNVVPEAVVIGMLVVTGTLHYIKVRFGLNTHFFSSQQYLGGSWHSIFSRLFLCSNVSLLSLFSKLKLFSKLPLYILIK